MSQTNDDEGTAPCGLCGRAVAPAALERHVRRRHGYVDCPACSQRVKPENLGHHALRQHRDPALKTTCPVCDGDVRATDFARHLRESHAAATLTAALLAKAAPR